MTNTKKQMKYKTTLFTLILFMCSCIHYGQKTIYAEDILNDIRAGKEINYTNVTISGILDLTNMKEQKKDLPKKRRSRKQNNSIKYQVNSKISFTNCTFIDHVLAYIPDHDKSGYTFIADFNETVVFKNCVFERNAMFKHSKFMKETSFTGSKFEDNSTFKHAYFYKNSDFSKVLFEDDTTFKHTIFKEYVKFESSEFREDANFKHTLFNNGLSLASIKIGLGTGIL